MPRDRLAAGQGAGEDADRDEEQAAHRDEQVAADQRAGIEVTRVAGRTSGGCSGEASVEPQKRRVEKISGGELAQHDLGGVDGRGEQGFQRAQPALLGEGLHGQQRHHEEHREPEVLEEDRGRRGFLRRLAVAVEDVGKDEAHHEQEEHRGDIRARVVEQGANLVREDGEVVAHGKSCQRSAVSDQLQTGIARVWLTAES